MQCHIPEKLNVEKMKKALKFFVGEHDFKAFRASGGSTKGTIRTIYDAKIEIDKENIHIYLTGNGFLYNMVRIISGTLVDVGLEKIEPEYIEEILLSKDRKKAGRTLPAQGLCLMKVEY